MHKEIKGRIFISPINPYTPRQAEIIELKANGSSYKQIADQLGINVQTVKNQISGTVRHGSISIYDRTERITGRRPFKNFITPMIGDVLFFREE